MSADPDAPVGDLLGRATHVDIDDVGALRLGDPGALRHPLRLAAGELDDVDIDAPSVAATRCLPFAPDKAGTCRHFRHDQAGAESLSQPAERRIGNSGHRRQNHPVRHAYAPTLSSSLSETVCIPIP